MVKVTTLNTLRPARPDLMTFFEDGQNRVFLNVIYTTWITLGVYLALFLYFSCWFALAVVAIGGLFITPINLYFAKRSRHPAWRLIFITSCVSAWIVRDIPTQLFRSLSFIGTLGLATTYAAFNGGSRSRDQLAADDYLVQNYID